jgi:hypothetical protein
MVTKGWKIRRPAIVDDRIDDEVIAMDTVTGNYFSMEGTAAAVWACLAAGCEEANLVQALTKASGKPEVEVREGVRAFLDDLLSNRLVEEAESVFPPPFLADRVAFDPPVLNRYTDMQDFLLLDPLHEVDDAGWPKRPQ